jgi:hypothetical protein
MLYRHGTNRLSEEMKTARSIVMPGSRFSGAEPQLGADLFKNFAERLKFDLRNF